MPLRRSLVSLLGVTALACISILDWPPASSPVHFEGSDRGPAVEASPTESCSSRSQLTEDDTGLLGADADAAPAIVLHASHPCRGSRLPFAPRALARAPKQSPPSAAAQRPHDGRRR